MRTVTYFGLMTIAKAIDSSCFEDSPLLLTIIAMASIGADIYDFFKPTRQ